MLLKSRASPDILPFSFCNKKILAIRHMNRLFFPTTLSIPSYDIRKQVGLRTYKHPLVKGPFLSCSAALVVRAGVRCTSFIGTCETTVSDYGVESFHSPPPRRRLRWLKRVGRWTRRPERVVRCGWWCVWRWLCWRGHGARSPLLCFVQRECQYDPVCRHSDSPAMHRKVGTSVRACDDCVGAAVRRVQYTVRFILLQKDMCRVLQGLKHSFCQRGITRCRNWTEQFQLLAELVNEIRWRHIVGGWGQRLTRNSQVLTVYEIGYRRLHILLEGRSKAEEEYG